MKKCMLIALITVFALVSLGAHCSAQSRIGVANTSKKGSLLVFPLVKVAATADSNDTIITISNDYPLRVNLLCRYQTPQNCACETFDFALTGNQSIAFSARTGYGLDGEEVLPRGITLAAFPTTGGEYQGELRCWAVNGSSQPISYNWLSGTATIMQGRTASWEYSAWRFAVGYGVQLTKTVGDGTHLLRLTGTPTTYDACPSSLIFNFIEQVENPGSPGPSGYTAQKADNRLTLVPCKQDCVAGSPIRVAVERHNELENSRYAYACYDCSDNSTAFFSKSLLFPKFVQQTPFTELGTPGGMGILTFTPKATGDECSATYGIPMLGVISNRFSSSTGPIAGETLTVFGRGQPQLTLPDGSPSGIDVTMSY